MADLERLARAALERQALRLRMLADDLLQTEPRASAWGPPTTSDPRLLAVAASLAELLSERTGQPAPAWTSAVGPLLEPFFLVQAAEHMPNMRALCERESPEPLRRRRLFAPPNFLTRA